MAPLEVLCYVALSAAAPNPQLDDDGARRLWSVYMELVEFEHKHLMDEHRDRGARRALARQAALLDAKMPVNGGPIPMTLKDKLMRGLTAGTEEADIFVKAYSDTLIESVRTQKPS